MPQQIPASVPFLPAAWPACLPATAGLREAEELFNNYHGSADGRISVMLGPHAPYTCPPEYLKRVLALADRLEAEIHIHLAETQWEIGECHKEYGKTPFAVMADAGLFRITAYWQRIAFT